MQARPLCAAPRRPVVQMRVGSPNRPSEGTSFVGRAREVETVPCSHRAMPDRDRYGVGGVSRTCLAVASAARGPTGAQTGLGSWT